LHTLELLALVQARQNCSDARKTFGEAIRTADRAGLSENVPQIRQAMERYCKLS
jgi:hypothetical protein